jgi:hypothetical protein
MPDTNRTPDQAGRTEPASSDSAASKPDTHFYEQAVANCNTALAAGNLSLAMLWARQAELLGAVLEQTHSNMPEVANAYARIMLAACLRSQDLALTTGNVLPEHTKLGELLSTASDRLNIRLSSVTDKQPRLVALMAHGYVQEHQFQLAGIRSVSGVHLAEAGDLDELLDRLAKIEDCAEKLCDGSNESFRPLTSKLTIAETAVSNARYSIGPRLFGRLLTDWAKAEFFLKRAFLLLAAQSITDTTPLKPTGNSDLDRALGEFPQALSALERRDRKDSLSALTTVGNAIARADRG